MPTADSALLQQPCSDRAGSQRLRKALNLACDANQISILDVSQCPILKNAVLTGDKNHSSGTVSYSGSDPSGLLKVDTSVTVVTMCLG